MALDPVTEGIAAVREIGGSLIKHFFPDPAQAATCGFALLYAAILDPMARFVATVILKYVGPFPVIDTTITMQVLFGLLGLGGMRMYEKVKGAEGNR
jgi:hypothetical protein